MGMIETVASKGYGEDREHEQKGGGEGALLYSPCCAGGDTGLAGAHIVFIAPIKSSCGR
jgi:hypothetical protein